jgi:hypothetical protein
MMQIAQTIFQELTAILQRRIQSAQERVQTTEDERMNRYYKGQADTLSLVLHDIDALRFDFGMELNPEVQKTIQSQTEIFSPAPKLEKPVKRKGAPKNQRLKRLLLLPMKLWRSKRLNGALLIAKSVIFIMSCYRGSV